MAYETAMATIVTFSASELVDSRHLAEMFSVGQSCPRATRLWRGRKGAKYS
jgi:hypothetical protein